MTNQSAGRNRVRRLPERGRYEEAEIHAILDANFLAYAGFAVDGQPFVIPTLFGRKGNKLYLHGSAASRMLHHLENGAPACITVALTDGLVLARSAFHHSINYRSVVAFGTARKIEGDAAKNEALKIISEHLLAGRWEDVRPPKPQELKATTVLEFTIEEASAKVREGGPHDDEEDYALPVWAGVLPLAIRPGEPVPDERLKDGIALPEYLKNLPGHWKNRNY
jgi:nitroimidazol reductase NimA-like FMN-containing flavoprotein (pyridoxamine 5'-phosphate oxidase superfamily)